jgi:Rad3-related DNA helicase
LTLQTAVVIHRTNYTESIKNLRNDSIIIYNINNYLNDPNNLLCNFDNEVKFQVKSNYPLQSFLTVSALFLKNSNIEKCLNSIEDYLKKDDAIFFEKYKANSNNVHIINSSFNKTQLLPKEKFSKAFLSKIVSLFLISATLSFALNCLIAILFSKLFRK